MDDLIVSLEEGAITPNKAHLEDAGYDLFSRDTKLIKAGSSAIFDTGVHVAVPYGYAGFLKSKSGLNMKHDLMSFGVIDCGYTGSIVVKVYNLGDKDYLVHAGDKITQLCLVKIAESDVKVVGDDEYKNFVVGSRGRNGFGSTGI